MNLANKVSSDDIQRVDAMRNPPEYQDGFDQTDYGGGSDLDNLFGDSGAGDSGGFGDMDDIFGGGSSGGFGDNSMSSGMDTFGGGNSGGMNTFGGGGGMNAFGGGILNQGGFGIPGAQSPFGGGMQQQQQQVQPDNWDKAVGGIGEFFKATWELVKELGNSIKLRNADDFGYLGRNMLLTGGGMTVTGIVVGTIGSVAGYKFISFSGMPPQVILTGGLSIGAGLSTMGIAAFILTRAGDRDIATPDALDELPSGDDNAVDEYEEHNGDILDDLFGDDFELTTDEDDLLSDDNSVLEDSSDELFGNDDVLDDFEPEPIDFERELENIGENRLMSRQTLFEAFKPMLPTNTPKFSDVTEITKEDSNFSILETICMKALANLANCQLEEIQSHLESARETMFSYELRVKRINKVKKTDDLAREIEVYMRDSSDDDSVNATVSIEGDFYKIIVTKGTTAVVTFGDIFKKDYCCEFYLNTKKKLPMITGINELGEVLLDDAKNFDTMLIAGKPRSGKSWYVLSILISLMLFNAPESVQFLIIDPKKSNLFKTMSLMPHVMGLHDDSNILKVLGDIIDVEAPRRKELLSNERCDDIWALRDKGIMLPILYIVIDEYITVISNLDKDEQKEFDTKFQIIISQLPSLGIRLLFVPHRATGIVNKTNRTMIQYTAAVRADIEDVKDTLGVSKWDRALTKPGDTAVKHSMIKNAVYIRGAALTTSDGENSKFIETAAKAFYKMGVDIPDMSNLRIAYNRDEQWIQEELSGTGNRVQFNAANLQNDADNIDLSQAF